MYVVNLLGDIQKIVDRKKLNYLKSLGFFVTGDYVRALQYKNALANRGNGGKYANYFA